MIAPTTSPAPEASRTVSRLGLWAAIVTVVIATVFAAVGIATPARSGPFCGSACVAYPYVDVAQFIPGDYLWLVPGILLAPTFVVLMACIHAYAPEPKKIYSRIGLSFALVYAVVILVDYFLQFAVVVPSLQAGETAGLSLFTQYDPHGLFIALESLGYLAMSVAFLCAAPVLTHGRAERAIRGLFVLSFVLAVAAFVGLAWLRSDLVAFEVSVLTINWIVLIASGALLGLVFRRADDQRDLRRSGRFRLMSTAERAAAGHRSLGGPEPCPRTQTGHRACPSRSLEDTAMMALIERHLTRSELSPIATRSGIQTIESAGGSGQGRVASQPLHAFHKDRHREWLRQVPGHAELAKLRRGNMRRAHHQHRRPVRPRQWAVAKE